MAEKDGNVRLLKIFFLPPIAIGRLGGSPTPLGHYRDRVTGRPPFRSIGERCQISRLAFPYLWDTQPAVGLAVPYLPDARTHAWPLIR